MIQTQYGYEAHFSFRKSNTRGVAISLITTLNLKSMMLFSDIYGNSIMSNARCNYIQKYMFINVYGPNGDHSQF